MTTPVSNLAGHVLSALPSRHDPPEAPQGAVNLALIATSPEELAKRAEDKHDGPSPPEPPLTGPSEAACGPSGPSATEGNDQEMGPLLLRRSNHQPPPTVVRSPKRRLQPAR
jgi:hypothetical protein